MKLFTRIATPEEFLEIVVQRAWSHDCDRDDWLNWYQDQHDLIAGMASLRIEIPLHWRLRAAAVLSPLVPWENALSTLGNMLCGKDSSELGYMGTYTNIRKAARCLMGEAELSGRKVQDFYLALRGDTSRVVIDRWAARVCTGGIDVRITDARYSRMVEAYLAVARQFGIEPRSCQSLVWCYIREFGWGND